MYTNAKILHLYRTHDQFGNKIEKSQASDYGCINVRNMLSIEEVLQPATRIPTQPSHTETPTHIETGTHDQYDDTIESRRFLMMDVLMSETC